MSVSKGREFLSIPGPTNVPYEVLAAMHRPAIDIYSGEMIGITDSCLADLQSIFRTKGRTYIYAANGVDQKINVLLRSSLEVLTSFGDGGRQPGQFFGVHNLDTDSKGNLYTAEIVTNRRAQRFVLQKPN